MADDATMTPITPEESGAVPPKATPFGAPPAAPAAAAPTPVPAAATSSAGVSTIKLKPVIRKPMIRKPAPLGAPGAPVASTPSTPAASAVAKKATQNLKAVTGPIPVQATLKKTGIIAEGILTPAQQQASKSKTSRISLESAIGVAPVKDSAAAPIKTIRLRRPTDLKPPSLMKPAAPAAPAEAAPAAEPVAPAPAAAAVPEAPAEAEDSAVTQKKTLKLHRPGAGIKRPSLGLKKPGETTMDAPAPTGDVPEMAPVGDIGDIPDLAPIADMDSAKPMSAGVPGWLAGISLVAGIAALLVAGFVTFKLYEEATTPVGSGSGANEPAFLAAE